jgi:hypothetical protein
MRRHGVSLFHLAPGGETWPSVEARFRYPKSNSQLGRSRNGEHYALCTYESMSFDGHGGSMRG